MGVASITLSEARLNVGIPGNLSGGMLPPARVGPDAFSSVAVPEITLRRWRGLDAGLSPLPAPSHRRRRAVPPSGRGAALLKPEGSSVCLLAGHQASPGLANTSQSDTVCRPLSSSPTALLYPLPCLSDNPLFLGHRAAGPSPQHPGGSLVSKTARENWPLRLRLSPHRLAPPAAQLPALRRQSGPTTHVATTGSATC